MHLGKRVDTKCIQKIHQRFILSTGKNIDLLTLEHTNQRS